MNKTKQNHIGFCISGTCLKSPSSPKSSNTPSLILPPASPKNPPIFYSTQHNFFRLTPNHPKTVLIKNKIASPPEIPKSLENTMLVKSISYKNLSDCGDSRVLRLQQIALSKTILKYQRDLCKFHQQRLIENIDTPPRVQTVTPSQMNPLYFQRGSMVANSFHHSQTLEKLPHFAEPIVKKVMTPKKVNIINLMNKQKIFTRSIRRRIPSEIQKNIVNTTPKIHIKLPSMQINQPIKHEENATNQESKGTQTIVLLNSIHETNSELENDMIPPHKIVIKKHSEKSSSRSQLSPWENTDSNTPENPRINF